MSTKINARSPYYIKTAHPDLSYVILKLYIYEGVLTTNKPATPQYTITKSELGTNNYVVFEISELIRDYLLTEYGNYSTNAVWVEADMSRYDVNDNLIDIDGNDFLAVDGFGYFEDGINYQGSTQLLQSNTIVYYNDGQDIVIPIWAEDLSTITIQTTSGADVNWESVEDFWEAFDVSWGFAFTPIVIADNGNTDQKIQYVIITNSQELEENDTVTIASGVGGATTVVTLKKICEPKYTPLNVIFYNKSGALQNMWFFKKNVTSLNTSSDSFKSNVIDFDSLTYSVTSPQVKTFNKNGKETIRLNSGFYDEQYNEVVRQLMLSEDVWIDNGTNVLPARVNTQSYTFKTGVNDKLIEHSFDFEYAFDKINNIR